MRSKFILLAPLVLLIFSCKTRNQFHEIKNANPEFKANTVFVGSEDLNSPRFNALKEKYQLDTIFRGETDELKRILLLRNWIRMHISIDDSGAHPGDGSCESILDHALKGSGYHCGHFMVVQNAIMNAYGYVTRCLGSGEGGENGHDGHHGIDEIWLNSYHKWFLSDAKYNSHFEKNGIPLSALEVRDAYLNNKAANIVRVKGPNRTPVEFDEEYKWSKEDFARWYAWLEWDKYNNRYTNWPNDSAQLIMYQDQYFKAHKWIWDGKPHWAYDTPFMNLVSDRNSIEWTPNTIASKITIKGGKALVQLTSNTPNFRTYQVKELPGENWKDVPGNIELSLEKDKNEFVFHSVNLVGVAGPDHRITIER